MVSTVDRRPSMILVTGFPPDCNKDDLINHFRKFGDIVENSDLTVIKHLKQHCHRQDTSLTIILQDSKSIILKYNLRKQAQDALNQGNLSLAMHCALMIVWRQSVQWCKSWAVLVHSSRHWNISGRKCSWGWTNSYWWKSLLISNCDLLHNRRVQQMTMMMDPLPIRKIIFHRGFKKKPAPSMSRRSMRIFLMMKKKREQRKKEVGRDAAMKKTKFESWMMFWSNVIFWLL